ncbi:uncharacterized protein F5891DRAFT_1196536 [Suillus fuscotomentosus]|uniref:Uncharacterized protein n=1 Tax=Suillus fuscotomentosus TaxID=1912939 RepID=A0AAD4HEK4_9AGAM|nr:uncharacterized protein F5891DRAFT_1196536 [Suillus fuscotomentosus]KAG1893306.1 hypothetical protein F5891DRAFT_1196536 [Suillus fuscotomentosus]
MEEAMDTFESNCVDLDTFTLYTASMHDAIQSGSQMAGLTSVLSLNIQIAPATGSLLFSSFEKASNVLDVLSKVASLAYRRVTELCRPVP